MKIAFAAFLAGFAASAPALAQDLALKPGLWQITLTRQVINGRDMLAERAAKVMKMQDALAAQPAERRQEMERQLSGVTRLCVGTTAVGGGGAGESLPGMGGCNPEKVTRDGATLTYVFRCEAKGQKISGQGERSTTPAGLHTRLETTIDGPSGRRVTSVESDLVYLGADCQGLASR